MPIGIAAWSLIENERRLAAATIQRRLGRFIQSDRHAHRPNGFKISCKVASVGLPYLERFL